MNDATNDFLMGGGGAPTASFANAPIGKLYKGPIVKSEVTQQTKMGTGEPLTWDDGKPRMQAVITIQTDERDLSIDDDNGHRRLFVKGDMQRAVRDAIKAAGAKGIEIGGMLAVQYIGDGVPEKGLNPPKLYKAEYRPPVGAANDLLGNEGASPAPVEQLQPQVAQPVTAGGLL